MLGIGFGEIILIAGIALIVIGPEKFPDFAKIVLRTVNDLRGYVDEIQKEVSKEIKPIKREIEQMSKYDPEKYIDALSKDIKDKVEKPATTTAAAPADTTTTSADTQSDDLSDTDTNMDTTSEDSNPRINNEDAPTTKTSKETMQPTGEVESESSPSVHGDDSDHDLDFSDPPIERLD